MEHLSAFEFAKNWFDEMVGGVSNVLDFWVRERFIAIDGRRSAERDCE